jgi:hypothetical protein
MNDGLRHILEIGLGFLESYGWWVAAVSAGMLVASLLVLRVLLVRIPPDYFVRHVPAFPGMRHPVLEATLVVLKNILGAVLVIFGLIMSLPGVVGQGVLTILAGLSLMNFPGKRRLLRAIVGQPLILSGINAIRHRAGQPGLILDLPGGPDQEGEGR